jgi:hypothetical protein
MHYLMKEATLDPMLGGIAAAFYAFAISAGILAYRLRKPEQLTPRTIRVQSDERGMSLTKKKQNGTD